MKQLNYHMPNKKEIKGEGERKKERGKGKGDEEE